MTRKEYKNWNNKAEFGTVSDELNPAFILSSVSSELLSQVIKGEIDLQELAKREMENRGLDANGKWVGFNNEIK